MTLSELIKKIYQKCETYWETARALPDLVDRQQKAQSKTVPTEDAFEIARHHSDVERATKEVKRAQANLASLRDELMGLDSTYKDRVAAMEDQSVRLRRAARLAGITVIGLGLGVGCVFLGARSPSRMRWRLRSRS